MNGDFTELYNKLDKRIAIFEEVMKERWNNRTNYVNAISKQLSKVVDIVNGLPCDERKGIYKNLTVQTRLLWAAIGTVIGVMVRHIF